MDKASVKDITDVIGQFGHWQRTIFIVVFCLGLPAAWNHLIIAFYAPNVAHWCIPSEISSNFSQQSWGNVTWRRREGWQECRPPENLSSEKCDKWMYDHSFYSATIIEEIWPPPRDAFVCIYSVCVRNRLRLFSKFYDFCHHTISDRPGKMRSLHNGVCIMILSESPRWLLTQGKLEEAETVLKKAALINKRNVDNIKSDLEMLQASLQQNSTENRKKANIFDLLKSSNLRKKTIIICFCWYVNAFVFYGLSLNTNEIGGNPFLSFFIFGAVEFPAYIVSIFVVKYYGRRLPLMSTMVLGGLACIATIAVPEDLLWLRMTLSMLGKFCITSSYIIVYIFSAEIFPTVVRNVGVGTSSTFARIGSAIAPFVKELGQVTHLGVTFGLFGGLAIVSGLLALCLPETNKIVLPDTLEQGEQFGKKIRKIPSEHELEKF
ncbi:organic cation transporter protein-like isoform X2 [Centruroides sculpturatus]|uniref:organic cation transporter protein-like isoform X2 n=1 Tax=Centruroides sculpturatus TaxID=218467 RepID=UPI000C6EFA39|nr:organic cation transporter protein-like isoform X2 [Centruroides sculpturatus]